MLDNARRIRQLHIKSQNESSISADINALQDAFNIASFPGLPPNGLLLIKFFDLGIIRSRSTSMAISKQIDDKIRAAHQHPVCVDQLEYGNENSVWFSDPSEAGFTLLKLVLNRGLPTAWYWPVIFPSLQKTSNFAEVISVISRDLPKSRVKPLVLVSIMNMLVLQKKIETILDVISLPLVQVMASEAGLYPRLISKTGTLPIHLPSISNGWSEVIEKTIDFYGEDDSRSHWLAFCALITANPALVESRLVWPSITALIEIIALKKCKVTVAQESSGVDELDIEANEAPLTETHESRLHETSEQENPAKEVFKFEGLFDCEYAGFGFLVPLLDFLSIDKLLSENPILTEINFPVRIMRLVAKRFGIDDEHPLLKALPETAESDLLIENFVAPDDWQTRLKQPSIKELEITVQLLMSRFLYRHAKMSLRSLIMREGQIAITRTHLDILFDIDQLDMRIRRAGLDINPGWVGYLGKVVQFHYESEKKGD